MRIEHLVVDITNNGFVLTFTKQSHIVLVAHIHNLFIDTTAHFDSHALLSVIRHKVQRALDGVEVARAVSVYGQLPGVLGRRFRFGLGREAPAVFSDAGKLVVVDFKYLLVDLYVVTLAVFKQVVVRMDRCSVASDGEGIEVKPISESTNDRKLKLV